MITAIVLAAGDSTRMGSPKALLLDSDGRPFVARLVRTFLAASISDVVVVTGARHDEIASALARDDAWDDARGEPLPSGHGQSGGRVRVVRNEAPSRGQLSSLWTGLDAAQDPDLEAVLVTLVDIPMVKDTTVRAVVEAWRRTHPPIARPAIGERHGHPVLFGHATFDEIRRAPLEAGAKSVVRAHASEVMNVPVDDEGCLMDVDTPDDYCRLLGASDRPR